MSVNIGPRIGIDGEAEYRKQINNIIQETKTLKSEYEKVTSSMEKGKTTLRGNAEQHKVLSEQITVQKEKIKQLSSMLDEASKKYGENDTKTLKWKQAVNEATIELNRLEAELKDLPNSIQLVGEKMESVGDKIKNAGGHLESFGRAITPISAAAAAGLTAAGKSFMDFEAGMSKVAAISGATGDDLTALTDKAKEMGATTKFSATESAEAFSYMAMAGWKTEQMLDGIAPVMNLAAASGEDLANVSDIVTDALTAFGLQAEDAGHFADVLAAASSNANTNVAMMGESFKYAAPVAGSLGYSIEDVAVALGLMANSGIKADMAGTSLRNMLNRMAKPTKESQMAMDRLGLSLEDANGDMYSLRDIMGQMRDSFSNINMPMDEFTRKVAQLDAELEDGTVTEKEYQNELEELAKQAYGAEGAEKARAAAMLGGTRAMSAMLAIANASEEDYQKLTAAVDGSSQSFAKLADGSIVPLNEALASGQEIIEEYNGTAEEMARIMEDNAKGAWTEAKSALEGAGIAAGEVLAPYIVKAADAVKDLANWFSSLDSETQETIVKTAALVAAAGPALVIGGKVTSGIGSIVSGGGKLLQMLGGLAGPTTSAAGSLSSLGGGATAAAAGISGIVVPAGLAAGAVAVLGAAFIQAYNEDEQFASEVNSAWGEIKNTVIETVDVIKPAWDGLVQHLKPGFISSMDSINAKLKETKNGIQGWINFISGLFKGDWARAWNGLQQIAGETLNNITQKLTPITKTWEAIFKGLKLELPHIKLPHFRVTGKNEFGLPSFAIDWYAKAMSNGMKLKGATIFGAANGRFLGGGEAGNEWIVGENSLVGMIRSAVESSSGNRGNVTIGETTIVINTLPGQDEREIADMVDEVITNRLHQAEAAWA